MNDLISRQAAIDVLDKNYILGRGDLNEVLDHIVDRLEKLPSAQPEIIRCKECKHWLDIDDGRQKHRMCADIYGDWFCADAERKTDE